ncbi:MAG TPA: PilX N-terminal domain-containing pilus assembly protein [Candidatus Angelobacter sp.]|jgi:Tfp pilus assembly protein PilX|nr:PilX N-terminal domain-containing pilus assembly protein [Candidatus Angelobacter sp.]
MIYSRSVSTKRTLRGEQKGVALITALLLLLLITSVSLAMVFSVRSDMLINHYYRDSRGSFYAADSGLNLVRRDIINRFIAAIPANFNPNVSPMPAGQDAVVKTAITTAYQNPVSLVPASQAGKTWPQQFNIVPASFSLAPSATPCRVTGGNAGATCANPVGNITAYVYSYDYKLAAMGKSEGNESIVVTDEGTITITATLVPASSKQSFAAWGMFIDQQNICSGSTLVPGTITGPVFTNGAWTFGTSGSYTFTDSVAQSGSQAGYQFAGQCAQVAGPSDKVGGTTIAPTFQAGFNLNQPSVPLPPNDFNQQRAVLDGRGSGGQVSPSDMNNTLRNINGNAYPNSATKTNGVWLPYKTINGTPTFTGGGIMVEGDAKVVLSASGANSQVYTITQGSTTTTVTINNSANTTTVQSGGNTLNITGVPSQFDPATGAYMGPATMLYVDGNITSLSGPGQGSPAVQDGTALTITAASNVTITGDILYKSEPVTLAANGTTPADTLIPANDHGQTLGIFTATGDIQLRNGQSNGNLEVDASLATISSNGTGGLTNVGSSINTLTIVGGRIQNQIKNINTTTRNVYFDRRYANGFAPPWFPSTTVTLGGLTAAQVLPSVKRRQWLNKSSYM